MSRRFRKADVAYAVTQKSTTDFVSDRPATVSRQVDDPPARARSTGTLASATSGGFFGTTISKSVGQPFGQTSQLCCSRSSVCICSKQRGHSELSFISIGSLPWRHTRSYNLARPLAGPTANANHYLS